MEIFLYCKFQNLMADYLCINEISYYIKDLEKFLISENPILVEREEVLVKKTSMAVACDHIYPNRLVGVYCYPGACH